ncbi:hypothetical protein [Streptomyces sp. NPDC088725]
MSITVADHVLRRLRERGVGHVFARAGEFLAERRHDGSPDAGEDR